MKPLGLEMARDSYFERVGLTPVALVAEFEKLNGVTLGTPISGADMVLSSLPI